MKKELTAVASSVFENIHRDCRTGFFYAFPSVSVVRAKWITNYGIITSLYANNLLSDYECKLLCKYNDIYYCKRY